MIESVAVVAGIGSMPHAFEAAWSFAAAGGAVYAVLTLLRGAYSRRRVPPHHCARGTHGADTALTQVSNPVNTTSDQPFTRVGASARWPAVWIGQAVCPPTTGRPPVPAARGQRRRLSVRSVRSITHQRGRK